MNIRLRPWIGSTRRGSVRGVPLPDGRERGVSNGISSMRGVSMSIGLARSDSRSVDFPAIGDPARNGSTRAGPGAPAILAIGAFLGYLGLIAMAAASFDRLLLVVLAILPIAAIVFADVPTGLAALLGYSSVVMLIKRLMPGLNANQVGLAIEGLILLVALRLAWDLVGGRVRLAAFRSPLTVPLLVFGTYLVLEVLNPLQPSLAFGLYGSRDTLRLVLFFVALAYLRDALQIRRFLGVFTGICLAEAAYGIWQHHHGLLYQEYNWLIESLSHRTHILFGYIRVFGTLGDAATYGFLTISGALLMAGLSLCAPNPLRSLMTAVLALPMVYAMVLSYSRGPMVAVVVAWFAMLAASRSPRLAVTTIALAAAGGALLSGLGDNRLVERILTATRPMEDASFQVRQGYIAEYLPRILAHPFGTGLYTAGASGLVVTGGRYIEGTTVGLPTDNQYFKYALELGWVGLALFGWILWALGQAIYRAYRNLGDAHLKAWALGLLGVFALYVAGSFSNDILVQKPISEWVWLGAGLAARLWQLGEEARSGPVPGSGSGEFHAAGRSRTLARMGRCG